MVCAKGHFAWKWSQRKLTSLLHQQFSKYFTHKIGFGNFGIELLSCKLFFCVNDGRSIDLVNPQLMHYIVCYNEQASPTLLAQWTRCLKGLITYFKTNVIIAMKKHVKFKHSKLAQKLAKEVSSKLTCLWVTCQPPNKKFAIGCSSISFFWFHGSQATINISTKLDSFHHWVLFTTLDYWECLITMFGIAIVSTCGFPFQEDLHQKKPYLELVKKTKNLCILPTLEDCLSTMITFDPWMLMNAHDIFGLVINFILLMATQTQYNRVVRISNWSEWSNHGGNASMLQAWQIWIENKSVCLHKKWRCEFGCNDHTFENCCEF